MIFGVLNPEKIWLQQHASQFTVQTALPLALTVQNLRPIQSNSSMHHYECIALYKDIILLRGWFWASSLASCSSRSREERSPWMVFIQVPPRWTSPAVRRRLNSDLAGVCILIHTYKMSKERKMTRLDNGWEWWLIDHMTKSCQQMPRIFRRYHWSTASIRCVSTVEFALPVRDDFAHCRAFVIVQMKTMKSLSIRTTS